MSFSPTLELLGRVEKQILVAGLKCIDNPNLSGIVAIDNSNSNLLSTAIDQALSKTDYII